MASSSSSSAASSSTAPIIRSRTLLFLSYRDSNARPSRSRARRKYVPDDDEDDDERAGLINSNPATPTSPHIALDVDLPPVWVDIAEQVEDILLATHTKIAKLDKLHAKYVLPGFSDRTAEEREIEAATSDITRDFRQCQALIKRIQPTVPPPSHTFPPNATSSTASRHEALSAKNVQRALAAKVQDTSAMFRKKQRVYMEKLQGHATKNQDLLIASGVIAVKGSEGMVAVDDDIDASQSQLSATVHRTADVDLQARHHELVEIARSISELADLFKDLSALVIDQGTLLDSVEYNIEQTAVEMQEAVKELDIATKYQRNTGRRQCIFLLILIIFGLIVVLIFKPRRHSSSSPVPQPSDSSLVSTSPSESSLSLLKAFSSRITGRAILQRRRLPHPHV